MDVGRAGKVEALAKARKAGIRVGGWRKDGNYFELVGIENGHPVYYETLNANAAISTGANLLQTLPLYEGLNGSGVLVGVWDAGAVRTTHQEFAGPPSRVTLATTRPNNPHSTHVAGTIAAAGIVTQARGMAPDANVVAYYMSEFGTSDYVQMEQAGASAPGQSGKLYLSNHSYGRVCGWNWADGIPEWEGVYLTMDRDVAFGIYSASEGWDEACYGDPYYLPFKAAGNDRDDPAPAPGVKFYWTHEYEPGKWTTSEIFYNSAQHPPADGAWLGGYDTVPDVSTAKNIMTVGSVSDAVTDLTRDVSKATMTPYSGWGPTDDGRIKPDIVANGESVYSTGWYDTVEPNDPLYIAQSDVCYMNMSGTSMASPNACGSAALLVQLYRNLFSGGAMLSSTLKGLIIHTADDLGNPGPDYTYGWGLMNVRAAADVILAHHAEPRACTIYEGYLSGPGASQSLTFYRDGDSPVRVTICWTDPPGVIDSQYGGNINSRKLIHDLDVRVVDVNGVLGQPYVLDPSHPDWSATCGDNIRDNVEQVDVSPGVLHSTFTVQVAMKNTPGVTGGQRYSLIVTGQQAQPHPSMIKGRVTDSVTGGGLGGVVLTGQPGGWTATTRTDGYYEMLVPNNWSPSPQVATVTPERYAYVFSPGVRDYNDVSIDRYEQNYTATLLQPVIYGTIVDITDNGVSGVRITTDPNVGSVYSDPNGAYSLVLPYGFTGTVRPVKDAIDFSPVSRAYTDVTDDMSGQDYATSEVFHRISGRVTDCGGSGLAGARVLGDPNQGAVYTDSGGYYYLDVARHFSGTLWVERFGYVFTPAGLTYPDVLTAMTGQNYAVHAVIYDGFADNRRGAAWVLHNDQPDALFISESSQRLNITAAEPNNGQATYRTSGWQLDPNEPFTMKVDFHMALTSVGEPNDAWVAFGFDSAVGDSISVAAGCSGTQQYYSVAAMVDGNSYSYQKPRTASDGTLFITYDPNGDRLYFSHTGYGQWRAWQTIVGALHGGSGPQLRVWLGGGARGAMVGDGKAWLDNMEINTGRLTKWPPVADINGDGYVDWLDVAVMADHWLVNYGAADLNKDLKVNFRDFALMAAGW